MPTAHTGDLGAAMRYAVLAPGKRIRPTLTVLAAWEVGTQDLRSLDAGCALEMVHAASLVLDDMPSMDDASERRGQPATHVRFGEDVAMLCAITLLSHAFATLSTMHGVEPEKRCALVAILAQAVGTEGLAGGQYRDLRPSTRGGPMLVQDVNRKKTGALFVAAADMAAVLHQVDGEASEPIRRCTVELGHAYQIFDDLLDGAKPNGDPSEDAGKVTLLSLLGQDGARTRLQTHIESALSGLRPEGALAGYIRSLFGVERVETLA